MPKPTFVGDPDDLAHFLELAATPIRSQERERALRMWQEYKLARQVADTRTKGGVYAHARMLADRHRVVDLRGAWLDGICLGTVDLRGVRLDGASLRGAWLKGAQFGNASLTSADFSPLSGDRAVPGSVGWGCARLGFADFVGADMEGALLNEASLFGANLRGVPLSGAALAGADLTDANLANADLRGATLRGATLERANLVGAHLLGTDLCGSRVYGVSAWDVEIDDNDGLRRDLIVTPKGEPEVRVDSIEVAQFAYLLLTNPKIRGVFDTVCKKGVLILGRFIAERKVVLDALRMELRRRGFVPMIFDFEKPTERDFTETVKTLAGLCRFIIADITNPKSSPLELQATVPDYMVPFLPIIAEGENPFAMFADLQRKYHWVLEPLVYPSAEDLVAVIEPAIIQPALSKHAELLAARAQTIRIRHVSEYKGE